MSEGSPLLDRVQLAPPSVLRNTPAPPVPASTRDGVAGDAANAKTVPPYKGAEVHDAMPATARGAVSVVMNKADAPTTKSTRHRRAAERSAMDPCTPASRRRPTSSESVTTRTFEPLLTSAWSGRVGLLLLVNLLQCQESIEVAVPEGGPNDLAWC